MSEQLLTKLSIRGSNLRSMARGKVDINGYDIAASLAYGRLSKEAYYFARSKYCDDMESANLLLVFFNRFVSAKLSELGLSQPFEFVQGMSKLMLIESVLGTECVPCKGKGFLHIEDELIDCNKCSRTGKASLSQRKRAEIVGVSLSSWHRNWNQYLPEFFSHTQELASQINRHIHRQLAYD
ncbi:hypothetical protein [Pleionea sediminis]|uniref:hypothetical protein n=1 Tax=Pleionea sediminis TaxID=2569479 RepID=UPI00118716CF|nr:hypothetical protein [Pleionea sediminis]